MSGVVIAGERSGAGKTTVTLALLAALSRRSHRVQSFKVGPDYIDPMFHRQVTGRPCYSLDPVLTSEAYVRQSFCRHSQDADYALVEGVMGLFDGASGTDDTASTAHIARLLAVPIVLVIDCSRLSRSAAALVHGYRSFDPRLRFAGLVLNRVGSDRHLELLKSALAPLNLPILGVLRRQDSIAIPDRHLGLVPAAELPQLAQTLDQLADVGQRSFDWQRLEPLLKVADAPALEPLAWPRKGAGAGVRIAIAQDPAFSFYYPDSLETLQAAGTELVPWSPLKDEVLPENVQGFYFGGGFPEVFAEGLSTNQPILSSLKKALQQGTPAYAECGGLMYLCQGITDFSGRHWPMVGLLPTAAVMGQRLTLGYRRATALQKSPLVAQGEAVWGHEFHRSALTAPPSAPLFDLRRYGEDSLAPLPREGWQLHQVHASYVHLHWGAQPQLAQRFVQRCRQTLNPKP